MKETELDFMGPRFKVAQTLALTELFFSCNFKNKLPPITAESLLTALVRGSLSSVFPKGSAVG